MKRNTNDFYASIQTSSFKIKSVFQDKSYEACITDYRWFESNINIQESLTETKIFPNETVCNKNSKDQNVWRK